MKLVYYQGRSCRQGREGSAMRKSLTIVVITVTMMLFCGQAVADQFEKGTYELQFDFALVDTDVGSTVEFVTSVGYLLTRNHQVGPLLSYTRDDPDDAATVDGFGLGAFYNYNFVTIADQLIPYVGAELQFFGGDFGDQYDTGLQLYGGIRVMPNKHAAVNVKLFFDQKSGSGDVEDLDSTGIAAGLSIFF